jgi:hypothetical protein
VRRVVSDDRLLMQLQSNVAESIRPVETCPLIAGFLAQDVELGTTAQNISHNLGRDYRGYLVVRRNADARVWETGENNLRHRHVRLQASAAVTVSIWFF